VYQGTVVLVSHDTDFVAQLAPDRAMIMPEGEMRFFDQDLLDLVALA
jgi:ATPase subunit of ABC transporter with duplicated ATPase domains